MTEPLLLGVRDAAAALGLGRDSAYQLVREGRLRHVSVGRRILIPRSELAAFIERESEGPGSRARALLGPTDTTGGLHASYSTG